MTILLKVSASRLVSHFLISCICSAEPSLLVYFWRSTISKKIILNNLTAFVWTIFWKKPISFLRTIVYILVSTLPPLKNITPFLAKSPPSPLDFLHQVQRNWTSCVIKLFSFLVFRSKWDINCASRRKQQCRNTDRNFTETH